MSCGSTHNKKILISWGKPYAGASLQSLTGSPWICTSHCVVACTVRVREGGKEKGKDHGTHWCPRNSPLPPSFCIHPCPGILFLSLPALFLPLPALLPALVVGSSSVVPHTWLPTMCIIIRALQASKMCVSPADPVALLVVLVSTFSVTGPSDTQGCDT